MRKFLFACLGFCICSLPAYCTVTTYTDLFVWQAAAPSPQYIQNFQSGTVTLPGLSYKSVSGPFGNFPGAASIGGGIFSDCVGHICFDAAGDQFNNDATIWTFARPMYGFAASFLNIGPNGLFLIPESGGSSIADLTVGPYSGSGTDEFFGFISTTPFTSVFFDSQQLVDQSGTNYQMDAVLLSSPVPEPSTAWLMLAALFGLAWWFLRAFHVRSGCC